MSPYLLFCSMIVHYASGLHTKCNLTSLPLQSHLSPTTIIAKRVHGLPISSGFDTAFPVAVSQYKREACNFMMESKFANWFRSSRPGCTLKADVWRRRLFRLRTTDLPNVSPLLLDTFFTASERAPPTMRLRRQS